jgi:DNA primase
VSGTALTKDHIRAIKRFAKTVYLNFDTDSAGIRATFSSIENLLNEDLEIRIIADFGTGAKDLDEFLTKG